MNSATKQNATKYAVLRFHQPANGRSYYQAREVGSVTCLKSQMWTTTDRDAAIQMSGEVGGTVVTV